eukprot:CAMPEP_0115558534 /NCGR_PEP_ID=MMETSP0271-20121206/99483_1 /TAXON_ID=71861 /ORGANISM="Scrippsiella trochoidea, Strain CCMP3099" /LENGTH=250 /DNA_ID=CAMNT_0002992543 /DNA_START=95 /DNA_END=844 /DNA_ORIENTATION=+
MSASFTYMHQGLPMSCSLAAAPLQPAPPAAAVAAASALQVHPQLLCATSAAAVARWPTRASRRDGGSPSRRKGEARCIGGGCSGGDKDRGDDDVLSRARDREGCRAVQRALEDAESDSARAALLAESLRGHVWEVARCPHGNHVLQKYVTTMKPSACQFIVDEFSQMGVFGIGKMARHKYACRVLQRLFEHCWPSQLDQIVDCLLADVVSLSMQRYGNYVVQHLLEYAAEDAQRRVAKRLEAHVAELALN